MKKLIVFFAVVLLLVGSCKKEPLVSPLSSEAYNTAPPTLEWPITSFASATTFYPFGDTSLGNPANKGYQIMLTDSTLRILSATPGVIASIASDGHGGNNILVRYASNSVYTFMYTGIGQLQVHVKDSIPAGAVLGIISHNGILGFSVLKNGTTAFCPSAFGSSDFNNSIQVAIAQSNTVNFKDDSIYSPCVTDSIR